MQKMWTYKSMEKAISKVQMIGRFLFFKYTLSGTEQMDCSLDQLFVIDFEEYGQESYALTANALPSKNHKVFKELFDTFSLSYNPLERRLMPFYHVYDPNKSSTEKTQTY